MGKTYGELKHDLVKYSPDGDYREELIGWKALRMVENAEAEHARKEREEGIA